MSRIINYRSFWDRQAIPDSYYCDLASIAKLVFDAIYDENRSNSNIETYCKKEDCWTSIQKRKIELSDIVLDQLSHSADHADETTEAKKEQKAVDNLSAEISIYTKGQQYWEDIITKAREQGALFQTELEMLGNAVKYCNGVYAQLTKTQVKEIGRIIAKLQQNGIE